MAGSGYHPEANAVSARGLMQKKDYRLAYIDNIRLFVIILVIMVHLAVTYSGIGSWFYYDLIELSTPEFVVFGFFQSFTQSYIMGLLFLIAGYFVPVSYDKKGFDKFIKERFIRLGIPTLMFMLILTPFINAVLLGNRGFGDEGFWAAYLKYIISFEFIRQPGPLWFAFALLIFSIIYAIFRVMAFRAPICSPEIKSTDKQFPGTSRIIVLILLIAICTFLVRVVWPVGTNVINMQLCYFSQYIILFAVGIKCRRNNWLDSLCYERGLPWLIASLVPGSVFWVAIMITGGALDGDLNIYFGGINWQSAAYAFWDSFNGVAMSIGLIALFKDKFNKQNKLIRNMSGNAFSVYVFHAPVIIALSLLFVPVEMSPIIKFAVLVIISVPVNFLFANFVVRKIPFWKYSLHLQ
jgi:fucose 4-O-acetylase-like acetyltransferase